MQKKAARRGQRALAFLLCLLMVVTLLPVMGASAAEGDVSATGVELNKTLTLQNDGTYAITLEAYATGTVKTEEKTAGVPCDIVLVLDQSGSMAEDFNGDDTSDNAKKRITALKTAATTFVNQVQQNAAQYNVDHKVAIVGFASGNSNESSSEWKNTELLSTEETVSYSNITTANYQDALVSANSNGTVNNRLTMAIDRVDANGATYGNYGLTMAKSILDNRTVLTYTKPDGTTANRKTIVVFFTDGYPGRYATNDRFYDGKWKNDWNESSYNNITVANSTIDAAAKLKQAGATVYSVGIFSGAAPTDDYNFSIQSRNKNNCTYYDTGTKAANAYMHFVSSDYDSSCTSMTSSARSPIVNNGYYLAASNADDLNKVFETISASIDSSSTSCTLDAESVLTDVISGNLDLPEGFSAANNVSVQTAAYQGGGSFADPVAFAGKTVEVSGKTIKVSGFDYSSNYVVDATSTEGAKGSKLIVTITGLIPNQAGDGQFSNENTSGIYHDKELRAAFERPVFDVDSRNVVIDFGMTANIAKNVRNKNTREGVQVEDGGTFTYGNDKTLTFKPTVEKDENGNYTLPFTGVSSALYYGVDYAAVGSPSNAWTWVNVIPANNVYYDDTYLNTQDDTGSSTFTDGQYGYEAAVETATNAADFKPEGSTTSYTAKQTFSFTGSRIDLYCTTTSNSNAVVAALWKAEDFGKDDTQPVASKYMINKYESGTLYNVPTLSFDTGVRGNYVLVLYTNGTSYYQFDGVRVYNPTDETNDTVKGAYTAENEANAQFLKVRDLLVQAGEDGTVTGSLGNPGVVYTDEQDDVIAPATYYDIGPKNEVYLAANNGVSFKLDGYNAAAYKVMVGLSAPEGKGNGKVTVTYGDKVTTVDVKSVNDMYYEVTPDANGNVSIVNRGNVLVSVTNIKVTARNTASAASTASVVVDEDLLNYVSTFSTLSVVDTTTPDTPDPIPDTPVQNDSISAIIHAIWAQVKTSIDRLFGRL